MKFIFFALSILVFACASQGSFRDISQSPELSFYVISDTHVYYPELIPNKDQLKIFDSPSKRISTSTQVLEANIQNIIKTKPRFVLISGDLTSEGETLNHKLLAKDLAVIEQAGISVFVVPGNHDLNNPAAQILNAEGKLVKTESPNETEFAEIYKSFGYDEALMRDDDSASYLARVEDGLYVLGIDSTWSENNYNLGHEYVGGRLSEKTWAFYEAALKRAEKDQAFMLVFQHHGVVPHYLYQEQFLSEYLLTDFEREIRLLSKYDVNYVFTGHAHSQDISARKYSKSGKESHVYDIETGSGVTNPYPYRVAQLDAKGNLNISSGEIELPKFDNKIDYINITENTKPSIASRLISYGFDKTVAARLAERGIERLLAQYAGDEGRFSFTPIDPADLGIIGALIGLDSEKLKSFETDIWPPDLNAMLYR